MRFFFEKPEILRLLIRYLQKQTTIEELPQAMEVKGQRSVPDGSDSVAQDAGLVFL